MMWLMHMLHHRDSSLAEPVLRIVEGLSQNDMSPNVILNPVRCEESLRWQEFKIFHHRF